MNLPTPTMPLAATFALLFGGALLVLTTYFAVRRGAGASSFGWALVNGLACALLGLAAALRLPESQGLMATLAQLLSVVLAAGLGWLCTPQPGTMESAGSRFGPAGRFVAWLTLAGLPPTPGFHAKIVLYRSLLLAQWPWMIVLSLLASWLLLLPALREARSLQPGPMRRGRLLSVAVLLVLMLILSLSPYLWLVGEGVPTPVPVGGV